LRILVSWLRDFVDVPVGPAQLASDLHLTGFEVASVEPPPGASSTDEDAVIDFEITANRPDCLSVFGMAREVATRYGLPLRAPALVDLGAPAPASLGDDLRVVIDDPTRCGRYCGALADVRVGPSPEWMVRRLAAAGVRAINNLVDITNYVLLELGHPMHAFDQARLGGREIRVRLPEPGERLTTLDGQERALAGDMLVIADAERATAVAGVMGGGESEVSETTGLVALESAWFEPTSVRRTSKRLGLSTEASYRFERGADIEAPAVALARACALIAETGAGRARGGWIDVYPGRREPRTVTLEIARVGHVLGTDVPEADIRRILAGLGFGLADAGAGLLQVRVPTWRVDVARDVDLIEDVARHHGYDRLPTAFPPLTTVPARPNRRLERDRLVRRVAGGAGFHESVTFSFIERPAALAFAAESELVAILNPLSEQFAVLRPSLLPGLVASAAHNRRRMVEDVRLFELGTVFSGTRGERRAVAVAWLGAGAPGHWSGTGRTVDFFDLKGATDLFAAALGLDVTYAPADVPFLVRGRAATVSVPAEGGRAREIGHLGQLRPALAAAHDIPAQNEVYVAEIDLDAALDAMTFDATVASVPPPRHPAVVRDLSIVIGDTLPAATVRGTIRSAAPATLVRVREFDRYQGTGVPEGRVSLSLRLTFQAPDRTLTDAEVQRAFDDILSALVQAHGAVQR
jgi:phenylalanyl-tRNA synthetase beta chain